MKKISLAGLLFLLMANNTYAFDLMEQVSGLFGNEPQEEMQETATTAPETTEMFSGGLVPALTETLGVTSEQASGGLGALFGLAKSSLQATDFSQLSESVPNMDSLLSAAPNQPQLGNASGNSLNSMLESAGGYGKALAGAKDVYEQFSALGLNAEHVARYIDITSKYLSSEGGQSAVNLFTSGVGSLLH